MSAPGSSCNRLRVLRCRASSPPLPRACSKPIRAACAGISTSTRSNSTRIRRLYMADPKEEFRRVLEQGLRAVAPEAGTVEIHIERPKNPEHGDLSSNVAMQLARQLKRNPREIAQKLVEAAAGKSGLIESLTIAGAGFLNVRFKSSAKLDIVRRVLREGRDFGRVKAADAR